MTDRELVVWLKTDLGITTPAYDDRLEVYIASARDEIIREGVLLTGTTEDDNLVVMYAAWMWRSRDTHDGMPRMLRYALNNRLFARAAGGADDPE